MKDCGNNLEFIGLIKQDMKRVDRIFIINLVSVKFMWVYRAIL